MRNPSRPPVHAIRRWDRGGCHFRVPVIPNLRRYDEVGVYSKREPPHEHDNDVNAPHNVNAGVGVVSKAA